jgi:hypothetical protein
MASQQSVVTNQGLQYDKFVEYKKRQPKTLDAYQTLGFISSGTYGNVFKAKKGFALMDITARNRIFAVKKFKTEKEGDAALASGISQSAIREIGLCRELKYVIGFDADMKILSIWRKLSLTAAIDPLQWSLSMPITIY